MKIRVLALILAAAVLLSGCMSYGGIIDYEDMEYTRPDLTQIQDSYDAFCQTAAGDDAEAVIEAIYDFYDDYDWFYTCYNLADIRYCSDLTDIYWEQEYNYCMELTDDVDALLEEMYYVLADSPCREALEAEEYFGEGFFDDYEGENLWDAAFSSLLEQEAQLQMEYYALSEEALAYPSGSVELYDACGQEMGQLLVELIKVRQDMAAYWNYDDYAQFANDFYYYRDYTPQQADALLEEIRTELVELYRAVNADDVWTLADVPSTEEETFAFVRGAAKAMGGTVWDGFQMMEGAGLYDIAYGENKYGASFEVYLTSYYSPFVFMNSSLTRYDCLTLAHEFGHFCNDYACYGSYAGIDVMEVFSQGMEYLSLCYGENTEDLTRLKMADSLCIYVEQAAFAQFEQEMYRLEGDDLSVEGLNGLYEEVILRYGFDSLGYDPREYVEITHFYTNPMYIISYVVSNDAALQLYQLEQEQPGAGLAKLEDNLESEEYYFLSFLTAAQLESPFAEGRIKEVRETFEKVFG
ncbi:MAG: hypothetical protein IJ001_02835 [Oscillospiraceae bacterium]|nr:hypothetical protein [Oscillospiraceae bacterium]